MVGLFEKVSKVKHLIRKTFPELDEGALISLVRNAAKWHYNKKNKNIISQESAKLYELLMNNGYNPDTVYKWLLLTKSPFELREKLKHQLISQKQAFCKKRELNTLANTSHQELLKDIINCVERYMIR